MSKYNDIRKTLGAALRSFNPALNVYLYVPDSFVMPAAIIKPQPHRTIGYLEAQSSNMACWYFYVQIVIGEVYEEAAQDAAGELISPGSPLIVALQNCMRFVQVTDSGISSMGTPDGGTYTYAQLSLMVQA